MGLVKAALKFRITVYVMSLLILLGGIGAILTMPKDVLPNVDIPVVSVIWTYTGLDTREMEQRVTTYSEFSLSNNVNGIRNIESQTLQGVTIEKVYFQPDVSHRPGDLADRRVHQLHPGRHAAGHPAADRGAVQCLGRSRHPVGAVV